MLPLRQSCVGLLVFEVKTAKHRSDVGPSYVQLEPCTSLSISVKSDGWPTEPTKNPFIKLPPSTPTRKVLCFLRPDDSFQIGDRVFLLQAQRTTFEQEPSDQEVQVQSSRPNSVDNHVLEGARFQASDPPATPSLSAGAAVMETPMANRYEPRPKVPPVSTDRSGSGQSPKRTIKRHRRSFSLRFPEELDQGMPVPPTPTEDQDIPNHDGGGGGNSSSVPNGLSSKEEVPASIVDDDGDHTEAAGHPTKKLNSVQANLEKDQSSQITGSSGAELPETDPKDNDPSSAAAGISQTLEGLRLRKNPRKRPSVHIDAEAADDTIAQSLPQKRRKGPLNSRVVPDTNIESQNSIKSTIYVNVPDAPQVPSSIAEPEPSSMDEDNGPQQQPNEQSPNKEVESTPRNRVKSTDPPSSSARSVRSSARKQILRVVYASTTTINESTAYAKFLRQQNVKPVKNIKDCDILCVGKGELKRTSNLILAVLLGKDIVTDEWIVQSAKKDRILDTAAFTPKDPAREKEWGFSLVNAIDRGRRGVGPFKGWIINFTPTAKKELGKMWIELKEVCLAAGAESVEARKVPERLDTTIVVAAPQEPDSAALGEGGWKMYTKDIVTFSALRGKLDPDSDEFLMDLEVKKGKGSAKKKKR
ncbi:MAG: hypothetical protein Q9218_007097 [Villophora microphyllina]